jgi:hypothetical protein
VLAELMMLDPLDVGAEVCRGGHFALPWGTGTAYTAVWAKDPSELSREDVMTVMHVETLQAIYWTRGFDAVLTQAGVHAFDWFGAYGKWNKLTVQYDASEEQANGPPASDAFIERLCLLALDVIRGSKDTTDHIQSDIGAWIILTWAASGRPSVAVTLIEAGVVEEAVATIKTSSPNEWVSWRTKTGVRAAIILCFAWTLSTLELPMNKTLLVLEKGLAEAIVSLIKAFEAGGYSKVAETSPNIITCALSLIASLDLTTPEAVPIVQLLEGMPTALQFVLENPLSHVTAFGMNSDACCAEVCALAFGKQEAGEGRKFVFSQDIIDLELAAKLSQFSGNLAPFTPVLPDFFFRSIVHLCISDENKNMLLRSNGLMALLMEALLIDQSHGRQNQHDATKGSIQRDALECFMQLALFDPGRDMLQKDVTLLDALRMLADKALTDQARHYAQGALMALLPPEAIIHSEIDPDTLHVFVSYQWAVQVRDKLALRSKSRYLLT